MLRRRTGKSPKLLLGSNSSRARPMWLCKLRARTSLAPWVGHRGEAGLPLEDVQFKMFSTIAYCLEWEKLEKVDEGCSQLTHIFDFQTRSGRQRPFVLRHLRSLSHDQVFCVSLLHTQHRTCLFAGCSARVCRLPPAAVPM